MNNGYLLKHITINNDMISYYEKDNKAKFTILFIHGYNSSSDFAQPIFHLKQNFNIVVLNFPGSHHLKKSTKKLTIDLFNQIVQTFINKHLKSRHIILLGHSLGGGTVVTFGQHPKVKKIIFLAPIHPEIVNSDSWKKMRDFYTNAKNPQYKKYLSENPELQDIFNKKTPHAYIVKKYLLNKNYVTRKLRKQYQESLHKKPLFIIGTNDYVIETKYFVHFVENYLKQKVILLKNIGHSPIEENPILMNNLLNNYIKFKRRFWVKNLVK